jgi:hypothetical protein
MSSKCFRNLPRLAGVLRLACACLAVVAALGIRALRRPAYSLSPVGALTDGGSTGGGLIGDGRIAGGTAALGNAPLGTAAPRINAAEPEAKKSAKKENPKTSKKEGSTGGASGSSGGSSTGDSGKAKVAPKKVLSIDEEYVKENLKNYLSPTKIEWKDDGSVKLVFNFRGKRAEHESIFTPPVSKEVGNNFRWSLRYEYSYSGRYVSDPEDERRDDDDSYWNALRIAMKGAAHLNLWLLDDLDVEIDYVQGVSFSNNQTAALVFTNGSGTSLGSNFGTQCVTFSSGRPQKANGDVEIISSDVPTKIRLVVKDGHFEAYRDGKKKSTMPYSPKSFASGRIGFIWGGGIAGFIHRIEIKGRVDAKKMAQILRKARK